MVEDNSTSELLFLQGKSDSYSLSGDSLGKYQSSDFIYYSPNPYVYLLNINNDTDSLLSRQQPGENKTILTNLEFRKGISLSMDRAKFLAQQGYGKVMYGLISDMFIYDVETGTSYRDSEPAKEALKTFYGVSDVDDITGYDLDTARKCLENGYNQALADGLCTETDKFVFDYPTWSNEPNYVKEVSFMQDSIDAAAAGTPLEGRITVNMVVSENYYEALDSGEYDICMNAWNGMPSDPYALMENYVTNYNSPQPSARKQKRLISLLTAVLSQRPISIGTTSFIRANTRLRILIPETRYLLQWNWRLCRNTATVRSGAPAPHFWADAR